jgi:CHAD domain-containing protein
MEKDAKIVSMACTLIRKQTDNLAKYLAGLDNTEDIEPLHQTRVACRRLREALVFFTDCFEPVYVANWKKAAKKLLCQSSIPRDLDVQIAFLEQFTSKLDSEHRVVRPGIERLLLRLKQSRRKKQKQIVVVVKKFQKKHVLINIRLQMDKLQYLSEIYPSSGNQEDLLDRFMRQVSPRLKNVEERQSCIDNSQDKEEHHKLRIAFKKLRYTIEIGNVILSGILTEYLESLKEVQAILGELHDCDVWIEMIDHFKDQEKQRAKDYSGHTRAFSRLRPGLEYLRQDRMASREKRYQEAVAVIKQWYNNHPLERFAEITEQREFVRTEDEQTETKTQF